MFYDEAVVVLSRVPSRGEVEDLLMERDDSTTQAIAEAFSEGLARVVTIAGYKGVGTDDLEWWAIVVGGVIRVTRMPCP